MATFFLFIKPTQFFVLFLIIFSQVSSTSSSWDYNEGGNDWIDSCKTGDQAPIDIAQPFTYRKSNFTFAYSNMMTEYSFYNDGNNLILEGDFGYMMLDNVAYFTSQVLFFSPSVHTFAKKQLPLEMQIIHHDDRGNVVTICVFFRLSKGDYSLFLGKLNFDDVRLKNMEPLKPVIIKEEINFKKYINEGKDFFIYEGTEPLPPCQAKNTFIILTDLLKISQKQLDNFPQIVQNKKRNIQNRNEREIFLTIKLQDAEKKQLENKEKVEQLKNQKDDAEKLKQAEKQPSKPEFSKIESEKEQLATMIKSSANEIVQNEFKKLVQTSKTNNTECENKNIIPFEDIKEQVQAHEIYQKFNDPKLLGYTEDSNENLMLDKEIPMTVAEVKRLSLESKYLLWKKLYEKYSQGEVLEPNLLIQMKILETDLTKSKYKPYLNVKNLRLPGKSMFLSFVQLENSNSNTNIATENSKKLNTAEKAIVANLEGKAEKDIINAQSDDDIDTIIDMFMNKVKNIEPPPTSKEILKDVQERTRLEKLAQEEHEKKQIQPLYTPKLRSRMKVGISITANRVPEEDVILVKESIAVNQLKPRREEQKLYLQNTPRINSTIKQQEFEKNKSESSQSDFAGKQETLHSQQNSTIQSIKEALESRVHEVDNLLYHKFQNNETIKFEGMMKITSEMPRKKARANEISDTNTNTELDFKEKIDNYDKLKNAFESVSSKLQMISHRNRTRDAYLKDNNMQYEIPGNIKKYERMNNEINSLSHLNISEKNKSSPMPSNSTVIKREIIQEKQIDRDIPQIDLNVNIYDTNLDYDKTIFSMIKLSIEKLIQEFRKLDDINQKVYSTMSGVSLLTKEGYLRVSRLNLATIIRKAYDIDSQANLSYDSKMSQLYSFIMKLLLSQNKLLISNNFNPNDHEEIYPKDVKFITEKVILKNELNQYAIDKLEIKNKPLIHNLVMKILRKMPIGLLSKDLSFTNSQELIPDEYDDEQMTASKKKENEQFLKTLNLKLRQNEEDIIITKDNAQNIREKEKIFGPKIKEQTEAQLSPQPGQGRKAVSRDGQIDATNIFDTSSWPVFCREGKFQSPININKPYISEELRLGIHLQAPKGKARFWNDNFKLILAAADFGYISHGIHQYIAKEIHIHVPSEHTFGDDEIRSPMEIQIVCQDMFGNSAILAVLFKINNDNSKENKFLYSLGFGMDNPIFALKLRNNESIEIESEEILKTLDIGQYVNSVQHYVTYMGSYTSPPCKANVQWFILLQKLQITENQLEYFPVLYGRESNVRGLQPLNNRPLKII